VKFCDRLHTAWAALLTRHVSSTLPCAARRVSGDRAAEVRDELQRVGDGYFKTIDTRYRQLHELNYT
jgi:hypothetical protein